MAGVKFMHSGLAGAPVLNGAVGALIPILDAILVNGMGSKSVVSLVIASGVATATVSGGHAFETELVARIAGGTVTGGTINGEHRVSATGLNTISFPVALPDQTATGSIVIDIAPAGWSKLAGTNKAAYHSTALNASGLWMRVDDSAAAESFAYSSFVRGYESMSDVDTGVNPFPSVAQQSVGVRWRKSVNNTTDTVPWVVFADEAAVVVCVGQNAVSVPASRLHSVFTFGDMPSVRPGDPYACAVIGLMSGGQTGTNHPGSLSNSTTSQAGWFARSFSGFAGAVSLFSIAEAYQDGAQRISGRTGSSLNIPWPVYPNRADNGLILSPLSLYETDLTVYRARVPGTYFVPMSTSGLIANGVNIDGSGALAGRRLRSVGVGFTSDNNLSGQGAMFVDITGPWR